MRVLSLAPEFLVSLSLQDLGDVEVAVGVGPDAVGTPEETGLVAPLAAPTGEDVPL